jgi:hypothetical protein
MKMKVNWLNILERAAWTFAEGFLIALPTTFSVGMDGAAWKSALIAAAMAGLSALKTFIIEVVQTHKGSDV